ncbi:NERD domain-containing protein [Virgibacillus sp. MSP4-1]|uniref:nuclease-related domain-containing protein n=1 Tax=Virgibacillus sp. MSP4-1 TaxID=2700081 RepID=UPI00039B87BC|nr:nuclease-related domain-containing protein [Virgibacillus sp. MSP4-1]QHS21681.1 NERD domain-containing protein [Virgibacillus sp. MSP4-1]
MNKICKSRTKSKELMILEYLNKRKQLARKDKQHYSNLKKGYEGEVIFDSYTERLQCECLILNDLLLEINNATFQIDSLIIIPEKIYFYEVKNHEGDYYYESDRLFKKPQFEITNPLHQLSRSESLLRQLFLTLGFKPQIDSSVVFINSNFTLYQAPMDKPIIFQNQVNKHLNDLSLRTQPSKLNNRHKKLAEQLLSMHITDPVFERLPTYNYDELTKGITCSNCQSFSVTPGKRSCICENCGYKESVASAVVRNVEEFKILFPNQKVTTNIIYDWCKIIKSKRGIREILISNYKKIGEHRWSYFK